MRPLLNSVHIFLLTVSLSIAAGAQPLDIRVQSLDISHLPRIVMKAVLYSKGTPYHQSGQAGWTLTENGVDMPLDVRCPDSTLSNSIAFVLDNSGSMQGAPIAALIAASQQFVDSLRAGDEAMLVNFDKDTARILQDFTTDKNLLKSQAAGLTALGPTPLWSASLLALQRVATRSGQKVVVIFSDGLDNASKVDVDTVMKAAWNKGITIYTVALGQKIAESQLDELAYSTGGKFFRIFTPDDIVAVFNAIATEVVSGACTISWTAAACTDSIRFLHLEARLHKEVTAWDSLWHAPHRSDSLVLRVQAPSWVMAFGTADVFVSVEPGLHEKLRTGFRFLLHFNPELLAPSSMIPITVGTMTENSSVFMRFTAPGVLVFSGDGFYPACNTGNLIGVRFKGLPSDTSRPVVLFVDSASLDVGCPAAVHTVPDTINACQCIAPVAAWIDTASYALLGRELRIPVRIDAAAWQQPVVYTATLGYDSSLLVPLRVETDGSASEPAAIEWGIEAPGTLRITAATMFTPATAGTLATVVFDARHGLKTESSVMRLPTVQAFARCCPEPGPDAIGTAFIEGLCDRVMRRVAGATLHQNTPNPVTIDQGSTNIAFTLDAPGPVMIELFDAMGKKVRTVLNEYRDAGDHLIPIDTRRLPRGVYTISLRGTASVVLTRMMVVL